METPKHDPNNRPKQGAALFRWILEQRKYEEANPDPAQAALREAAIKKLKERNEQRGTPIIQL
jgi:hypothetical protein